MSTYNYDVLIIGGGGAGITSAALASGFGKKIAMLDKKKFGGECTWSGCVPSKALLQSAKVAHYALNMGPYGLKNTSKVSLKTDGVMQSVRDVVKNVYKEETPSVFKKAGIYALEESEISFIDAHTVQVNKKKITAEKIFITTGSSPFVPPVPGIETVKYLTNETVFKLKKIPKTMVIMGGGPIGTELSTAFARLGSKVTIIEMNSTILVREDPEMVKPLREYIEKEGVTILTGARVAEIKKGKKIEVTYELNGKKTKISTDELLVAAGRKPNIEGLNLEAAGIKYNRRGIEVNDFMQTSTENIYAAGDVAGSYQFSHIANYQAITAVSNALLPIKKKVNYDHVPWATFTDPELARSGLTEEEAQKKYGDSILVYRQEYSHIDRGRTDRIELGLAKVITTKKGKIVGIHILGERASELMQQLHLAKSMDIPLYKLNNVIHAYPGYSDIIKNIARQSYIDHVKNNPFVKLIQALKGSKKK